MDTSMLKKINQTFKYGARIIQDGQAPRDVVDVSYAEGENGEPTVMAWAFPMKDMYFEVTGLQEREDGWVISANGTRYLFKPLDKKSGKNLSDDMKDA